MSYIGRDLRAGAFRQLDDISSGFDGSDTTHTMQVNSTNVSVGDVNQILLSLGGVIQKPGTDFTVSGSTLTFTTAPAANTNFFAILLGSDNGGTVTPTDGSVTGDKLASTVTTSSNISLDGGTFVFNESGADKDFRVESDNESSMLHVNAGTDTVLIGTDTPTDQWFNADASYVPGFQTFGNGNTDGRVTAFVNNQADAGGPIIGISKSRGTASNSYTVVQDDDQLGIITFQGADGTNLVEGARIAADVDGTPGADDMPGRLEFHTTADGASSGTERMRIHSTGNVSIGSTNGRSPLEIVHSDTGSIPTGAAMGATASDDNLSLGIHNENNSATFCGIALETRTTGAARIALLNQWRTTYIGDLDFQFRNGASQNQNHAKFRASGEGEFYFGTELATEGTSPVNPVSSNTGGAEGFAVFAGSYMVGAIASNPVMYFNRMTDDGNVIIIRGQGTNEGAISVSGSTVSFDAFTGSHWSRLEDNSKPTILKGTIMESLDKMMDWYQVRFTDQNNQDKVWAITLPEGGKVGDDYQIADPHVEDIKYEEVDIFYTDEDTDIPEGKKIGDRKPGMDGKSVGDIKIARPVYTGKIVKEGDVKHVYSKVSDTVESKKVYGLFFDWDDDDTGDDGDVNDFRVAQVGTFIIRVNKDVTVEAGDLLVSNGDGTAKKQDDDIIRSKTVAKVNSNVKVETYSDGSYTVPCTLHC